MKKYIHYCWFGGKPLPRLAKKCMKSWKKYLPDYEIKIWNESNTDINECPFIKGAYESKKWAFVADYARTKAIHEYGGLYLDTDVKIVKNIDKLLEDKTFLGIEDSGYANGAVWYESEAHSFLSTELLKKYHSLKTFDEEKVYDFAIPRLISDVLFELGMQKAGRNIQRLEHGISIYPRDYFYPLAYDRQDNRFTENTCMIHYCDASWIPAKERITNTMIRNLGPDKAMASLAYYRKTKDVVKRTAKVVLFPYVIYRRQNAKKKLIDEKYLARLEDTLASIESNNDSPYIAIHNGKWLGVTSATKELFRYTVDCGELYRKKDIKAVAEAILNTNVKQVIFSALSVGDLELISIIKKAKPSLLIKVYWHGSHSQMLLDYDRSMYLGAIKLQKEGVITTIGGCKKSLEAFYKHEGVDYSFLTNSVKPLLTEKVTKKKHDGIRLGLYAAKCDIWGKNMFTQIAAASMIDDAVLDIVPLTPEAKRVADIFGVKVDGVKKNLSRKELSRRIAQNDLTLYVTFSECAPMIPLESLEVGTPCITGNNHHYFKGSPLEDYLVVDNENDPVQIKDKILYAIENKDNIIKEYKKFKRDNADTAEQLVRDFLKKGTE